MKALLRTGCAPFDEPGGGASRRAWRLIVRAWRVAGERAAEHCLTPDAPRKESRVWMGSLADWAASTDRRLPPNGACHAKNGGLIARPLFWRLDCLWRPWGTEPARNESTTPGP